MGEPDASRLALRIERGRADEDELAAVAVVLCSVLAGRGLTAGGRETAGAPSWRRQHRAAAAYRPPHSWR
ncbi:acyl-CoA carboxylase epsilon subunit [Streptomyces pseudogriseolus]|uniref:acyl-CoA carboxylase epsilon subunit n=1 Tax=Streptomyces pseudogriseolus TaxID=36817 RepID=UPI003FA2DF0B